MCFEIARYDSRPSFSRNSFFTLSFRRNFHSFLKYLPIQLPTVHCTMLTSVLPPSGSLASRKRHFSTFVCSCIFISCRPHSALHCHSRWLEIRFHVSIVKHFHFLLLIGWVLLQECCIILFVLSCFSPFKEGVRMLLAFCAFRAFYFAARE